MYSLEKSEVGNVKTIIFTPNVPVLKYDNSDDENVDFYVGGKKTRKIRKKKY